MLKRLLTQFVVDLGELEGDYRIFYLKDDIAYISLYISIAIIGTLSMFLLDASIYSNRSDLNGWLIVLRGGYILESILVVAAIRRTSNVKVHDRFIFVWILSTILLLLAFKFTQPANFLRPAFYIIVPLSIYIFSPLKINQVVALALVYSVGALAIDYFHGLETDPLIWETVIPAQLAGHMLGLVAALQIQSYRRKTFKAYMEEKDAREMVAYLASIDPLTKSLTRQKIFEIGEAEFLRFRRYHRTLSMLVMDADHFKNINDTYGHYAGDVVLRNLSLIILEQKRTQDSLGRLGGEEFGLLLPETNLAQAKVVAQRVQMGCEQMVCAVEDKLIRCTISIGVAEVGTADRTFEDILRRADGMMYKAKEAGRNTIAAE